MRTKLLITLAPLAVNYALGFVTGNAAKAIDARVKTKALSLGLLVLLGGLSFVANLKATAKFASLVEPSDPVAS